MRIFSEKTNKEYASVEECVQAEKEYDARVAEEKAKRETALAERKAQEEKAIATRKADAEKVEVARKHMVEASKAYHEELAKFCEKHGSYHTSFRVKPGEAWTSIFDDFFSPFWF